MKLIAGVDEVGRGSLIGPVYAAAVILKKSADLEILKDSKQLNKSWNVDFGELMILSKALQKRSRKIKPNY